MIPTQHPSGQFPNAEDEKRALKLAYSLHAHLKTKEKRRAKRLLKASRKKWDTHYRALRAKRKQAKLKPR